MEINEIMEKKIYEREQFGEIMKWIDDREMLMFIGSRQTGKTSIMYGIAQRLVKSGKAKEEDIYFFDAENIREAEMLGKGPDEITAHIKPGENGKKYLF